MHSTHPTTVVDVSVLSTEALFAAREALRESLEGRLPFATRQRHANQLAAVDGEIEARATTPQGVAVWARYVAGDGRSVLWLDLGDKVRCIVATPDAVHVRVNKRDHLAKRALRTHAQVRAVVANADTERATLIQRAWAAHLRLQAGLDADVPPARWA